MPAITESSMKQLLQGLQTDLRKAIEENLDARLKPMQLKVDQLKARTEQQVATLTALRQELATRGGMDEEDGMGGGTSGGGGLVETADFRVAQEGWHVAVS